MNALTRVLIGLSMLSVTAIAISAQDLKEPPGKWWKDPRVIQQLNLTPEQQDKIESIFRKNRRDMIDQKAQLDRCRVDLDDMLSRSSVDETAALGVFDRLQAAREQVERTTFVMRMQIKNLLSAEQQKKLEEVAARLRQQQKSNRPPS